MIVDPVEMLIPAFTARCGRWSRRGLISTPSTGPSTELRTVPWTILYAMFSVMGFTCAPRRLFIGRAGWANACLTIVSYVRLDDLCTVCMCALRNPVMTVLLVRPQFSLPCVELSVCRLRPGETKRSCQRRKGCKFYTVLEVNDPSQTPRQSRVSGSLT